MPASSSPWLPHQGTSHTSRRLLHSSTARRAASTRTVDYLLADVGEGITECEIIKWFVEEGASVEEFDVLVEVQSDKASVEITSRYAGVVKQHCYKEGEVAKVGSALCKIEMQAEDGGGEGKESAGQQERSEGIEVAAAKTTSGKQSEGNTSEASPRGTIHHSADAEKLNSSGSGSSLATPAVRRIVRENGVDINQVKGSGKAGRVTKEDVQAYLTSDSFSSNTASGSMHTSASSAESSSQSNAKPLTGTRKAMFKAMSKTWSIPHFGYSDDIDISKLDQIRKEMQAVLSSSSSSSAAAAAPDQSKGNVVKLTMLPFLLKALSLALSRHAIFRSTLDEDTMSLHERESHNISIALSSSRGLLTPTLPCDIRHASIVDLAEHIQTFQSIITERGLNQSEMGKGATMTLSNIGNIGGLYTFPLIPPTGQLIIGAVGRSRIMPRVNEQGDIVKALILPASFSADHRVVEGLELARFVQDWKLLLENPSSWLLTMR